MFTSFLERSVSKDDKDFSEDGVKTVERLFHSSGSLSRVNIFLKPARGVFLQQQHQKIYQPGNACCPELSQAS